jgi:hypothetical protein
MWQFIKSLCNSLIEFWAGKYLNFSLLPWRDQWRIFTNPFLGDQQRILVGLSLGLLVSKQWQHIPRHGLSACLFGLQLIHKQLVRSDNQLELNEWWKSGTRKCCLATGFSDSL